MVGSLSKVQAHLSVSSLGVLTWLIGIGGPQRRQFIGVDLALGRGREDNMRWWLKLQPINHESPLLFIESHQNPRALTLVGIGPCIIRSLSNNLLRPLIGP
ncbi:hypothetical protein BHE74_00057730 [Ensete ventricosum]|nr:hypothetical protein BHE74_00057730 [Ensete ventricosum]